LPLEHRRQNAPNCEGLPTDERQGVDPAPECDHSMYSIYDEGLGRLLTTGRNSPTKEAAKDALLHYLSGSCSRVELAALSILTPDELAARHHYKKF